MKGNLTLGSTGINHYLVQIIDDAHSFVAAAEVLKQKGASKIYCVATHGTYDK